MIFVRFHALTSFSKLSKPYLWYWGNVDRMVVVINCSPLIQLRQWSHATKLRNCLLIDIAIDLLLDCYWIGSAWGGSRAFSAYPPSSLHLSHKIQWTRTYICIFSCVPLFPYTPYWTVSFCHCRFPTAGQRQHPMTAHACACSWTQGLDPSVFKLLAPCLQQVQLILLMALARVPKLIFW